MRRPRFDTGRLIELARKELTQTLRDPRALRVIFMAPIIQLIVFGYAVTTDLKNASVILFDRDNTTLSRELAQTLGASGYFRIT